MVKPGNGVHVEYQMMAVNRMPEEWTFLLRNQSWVEHKPWCQRLTAMGVNQRSKGERSLPALDAVYWSRARDCRYLNRIHPAFYRALCFAQQNGLRQPA